MVWRNGCYLYISGVVVIDDIFGEPIDDPDFSVENEGFQEVTSKKAQKLKQKAQQEAELKKQILTEKQKKEAHNKVTLIWYNLLRGNRDRMVGWYTTTYAISAAITTNFGSSNPTHGEVYVIQHYVIKFVSDLQVGGFLWVLQFPPPIKLTMIWLKYCWKWH